MQSPAVKQSALRVTFDLLFTDVLCSIKRVEHGVCWIVYVYMATTKLYIYAQLRVAIVLSMDNVC